MGGTTTTLPVGEQPAPSETDAAAAATPATASWTEAAARAARGRPRLTLPSAAQGAALGGLAGLLLRDLDLPALISYDHSREPLVLLAALAGAVLTLSRRLRPVLVAATAALALLWCVVAVTPLSAWLSRGLTRAEAVEPADAVFVSLASLAPGAQGPGEVRNRIFHAISLVARGKAPVLVLCDSPSTPGAAVARDFMDAAGLKAEVVVLGTAGNTREEALAVADLARKRGLKLLLLVTSPIHSRRASAALEKEGVTVVSAPSEETRFDLDTLDTWNDRLAAFGSVMHERIGIFVYARRGWVGPALQ